MHIFPISEEREKVSIKDEYIPRFEGNNRYFTILLMPTWIM